MTTAPSVPRPVTRPTAPAPAPSSFPALVTTAQVVRAVADAARRRQRVEVRYGGHDAGRPVADGGAAAVVDLGRMNAVAHDPHRRAFMVETGARLTDVRRTLYEGWGVTLPAAGPDHGGVVGQVTAGGPGALTRSFGFMADHLLAIEVVVVDVFGTARAVVASRERNDPHRDLWWAHTGGGASFGVVTRCWFRSPDAGGSDPTTLLPRPPGTLLAHTMALPRATTERAGFHRLVRNHGDWHEQHADADSPYAALHSSLVLPGGDTNAAVVRTRFDATLPDARGLLRRYADELTDGLDPGTLTEELTVVPWQSAPDTDRDGGGHGGPTKSAWLRRGLDDAQIDALHRHLTAPGAHGAPTVTLGSGGGRANTRPTFATAGAHRDSVLAAEFTVDGRPSDDAVDRLRRLYRDVFAATGGVPVPGAGGNDGCLAGHPDPDLTDPRWNTSGVPWHRLYYKDNYRRLQRAKARWDPRGLFGQGLGIRPA
ncbi:FAD-binding oxidoreductase [Streptomyces sp. NPDC059524]|uniref:FAD-binding oxidoreductase n=1 Tax=Streptomyces sp. NPDC059524 TaxID=3346856 RepID=UPI0036AE04BF